MVIDPNNPDLIFAGSDAGVFVSSNAGAAWALLGNRLPNAAIDKVFMDPAGTEIFVATHGRGLWVLRFPHFLAVPVVTGTPSLHQLIFRLSNTGSAPLNWALVAPPPSWLSLNVTSGSIPVGGAELLVVSFHTQGIRAGTILLGDTDADNSPYAIQVLT